MNDLTTGRQLVSVFLKFTVGICALIYFAGCVQPYKATLSPDLANQIQESLTFPEIKASPTDHTGKLVVLGGQVLSAKRLSNTTELVILQLPLVGQREPTTELTRSQGRYIAYQDTFLDPATVPAGTRITLVGELSGAVTQKLDETDYSYPTILVKQFKIWPTHSSNYPRYVHPYPFWGPYYPYAYPFWGPRGRFYRYDPYWYW